jgi:hypothetical protein
VDYEVVGSLFRALEREGVRYKVVGAVALNLLGLPRATEYNPPDGTFHIDILQRLGDMFAYDDIEAEVLSVEDIRVPVATARTIYRMKKDTVRLQDRADAERLREHFGFDED